VALIGHNLIYTITNAELTIKLKTQTSNKGQRPTTTQTKGCTQYKVVHRPGNTQNGTYSKENDTNQPSTRENQPNPNL